jgi:pimeloyl-ACP methyl ester carboxylesterase
MKLHHGTMQNPSLHFIDCPQGVGSHRMAYWQWGNPNAAHMVLCVHGLTRQGRDFDVLAQALVAQSEGRVTVVCPDVAGRGHSDWLTDPQGYQIPTYVADMLWLLKTLKPRVLDWVGTSMGGLIGMALCAHAPSVGTEVRRLVLNDVGPVIEWAALQRIRSYLGQNMQFASLEQALRALQFLFNAFGPHTEAQWRALSMPMLKPSADGTAGFALHYDPAIALPFQNLTQEASLQAEAIWWQLYDAITAPTLLLRGADSDLLSPATAQAMTQRGPRAQLCEFAGVGHAPALVVSEQVRAVASFLL